MTSTEAVLSLRKGSAEPEAEVPRLVNDPGGTGPRLAGAGPRRAGEGVLPVGAGADLLRSADSADRPPSSVLRMKLLGANPEARVTGIEELPGKSSAHVLKPKGTNLPEGLSAAEWSEIQKQIRASEYELASLESGTPEVRRTGWQALNRAQDLRTYFREDGIQGGAPQGSGALLGVGHDAQELRLPGSDPPGWDG